MVFRKGGVMLEADKAGEMICAKIRAQRGLQAQIARVIGLRRQAVCQWRRVPSDHARIVARILNVHPHFVRPDLYDPPSPAEPVNG